MIYAILGGMFWWYFAMSEFKVSHHLYPRVDYFFKMKILESWKKLPKRTCKMDSLVINHVCRVKYLHILWYLLLTRSFCFFVCKFAMHHGTANTLLVAWRTIHPFHHHMWSCWKKGTKVDDEIEDTSSRNASVVGTFTNTIVAWRRLKGWFLPHLHTSQFQQGVFWVGDLGLSPKRSRCTVVNW